MNAAIRDYARKLGLSDKALKEMVREHQFHHGQDAEAQLTRYLTKLWAKCEDKAYIPARQNGIVHPPQYVTDPAGALPDEPESPGPEWLKERAAEGWVNFGVVRGEEQARREARSRAERLRQAELELRQAGRSAEQHAKTVDDAIAAMRRDARAA